MYIYIYRERERDKERERDVRFENINSVITLFT